MEYITHKDLEKIFQGKEEIQAEDLVYVLEEKLGYSVSIEKKPQFTEKQKKRMTDWIFSNEEILRQLRESAENPDYIEDEEEFSRFIQEVRNER